MPKTYTKKIAVHPFGLVEAVVEEGLEARTVAFKVFSTLFFTDSPKALERTCEKAHKWADKVIAVCERQEA